MSERKSRIIFGIIYIIIMWSATIYSEISFKVLFSILAFISFYEMIKIRKGKSIIIPLFYIILPFYIIIFTSFYQQQNLILIIYILTWSFDTFAYVFGVKYGKTKILSSISPKKSWEGFFGGFFATILISYIISYYFVNVKLINIIMISIIIPFTATIGDFIESYYKRMANMKDSGNIIPGHGGILDRLDSFMITIPIIYIYSKFI